MATRHPGWEVSSPSFCSEDREAALGSVEDWWVDKAWLPRGGGCRRRQARVHGRRSSGCVPGRCIFSDSFFPFMVTGLYCGYFQSLRAFELLLTWVSRRRSAGDGRRQWSWVDSIGRVSRDFVVISVFLRGLCVKDRDSCLPYPSRMYLYVYCICTSLNF